MDSGISGSTQYQGDEEPNSSKGDSSISSFFNTNTPFLTNQTPNLYTSPQTQNLHLLPYSNGLVWSRGGISEQTYPIFAASAPSSSSTLPPGSESNGGRANTVATEKNPKKRGRVSRRATTTVLTTDPSNFREMVQEFTGIPTTPLSCYPHSCRTELISAAALQSAMRNSAVIPTHQNHLSNPQSQSHDSNIHIPMNFGNASGSQRARENINDGFEENDWEYP